MAIICPLSKPGGGGGQVDDTGAGKWVSCNTFFLSGLQKGPAGEGNRLRSPGLRRCHCAQLVVSHPRTHPRAGCHPADPEAGVTEAKPLQLPG